MVIPGKKDLVVAEEVRVCAILLEMKKSNQIRDWFSQMVRPTGSQPTRLYGLAKVHKLNVPLRPIMSMPGSSYHSSSVRLAKWLQLLPETNINTNSSHANKFFSRVRHEKDDECLVSRDVERLFTNVPVGEAIRLASHLLYDRATDWVDGKRPPFNKETFKELLMLACTNSLFQTADGFYRQTDGVAMGSTLGPLLANIFLSQYDGELASCSKVYLRYVDDIVRDMPVGGLTYLLPFANTLHEKLFTAELEEPERGTAFLELRLKVHDSCVLTSWFHKEDRHCSSSKLQCLLPTRLQIWDLYQGCSQNFLSCFLQIKTVVYES